MCQLSIYSHGSKFSSFAYSVEMELGPLFFLASRHSGCYMPADDAEEPAPGFASRSEHSPWAAAAAQAASLQLTPAVQSRQQHPAARSTPESSLEPFCSAASLGRETLRQTREQFP